jgi:GAF domain-containing protein
MNAEPMLELAGRLTKILVPGDLDETLSRITAAAVAVLPEVEYASITVKHSDGGLETVAPTDDLLRDVDAAQYELREGPCYYAATDTIHVVSPDLATDPRFPRYAEVAIGAGLRAQAGLRLYDAARSQGALNLYSRTTGSFRNLDTLGALFTHQSAMAIGYAYEIQNLNEAVRTRGVIGQAVGIVMERYQLSEDRAFAFLVRLSQQANLKLRKVAEQIVATVSGGT